MNGIHYMEGIKNKKTRIIIKILIKLNVVTFQVSLATMLFSISKSS